MVYAGNQKPTNKISMGRVPIIQELKVETATTMYPGRLVTKGTNPDDVIVNTASTKPIGWLGYEQTAPVFMPATVDTIYAQNDHAAVLSGGGFYVVASLASGQNVTKGAQLVPAAAGELKAATNDTLDASTNYIVAIAEENVNASGAAADILVKSMI